MSAEVDGVLIKRGGRFGLKLTAACSRRAGQRVKEGTIWQEVTLHGERGGTRTLDPMIKSHVLYHLSYALTCRAV
jgi:hypothetical protein